MPNKGQVHLSWRKRERGAGTFRGQLSQCRHDQHRGGSLVELDPLSIVYPKQKQQQQRLLRPTFLLRQPQKESPSLINFWFPRRLFSADFSIVLAQHKGEGRKKAFHQLAPTISKSNETAIDGTRLYNFFFLFFFGPVQGHTNWTYFPYRFSVLSPLCQTARTTVDMRVNHWEMGKQRITKRGATERR